MSFKELLLLPADKKSFLFSVLKRIKVLNKFINISFGQN